MVRDVETYLPMRELASAFIAFRTAEVVGQAFGSTLYALVLVLSAWQRDTPNGFGAC